MTREDKRKYYKWLLDSDVEVGGLLLSRGNKYLILNVYKDGIDVVEIDNLITYYMVNIKTKKKLSAMQCKDYVLVLTTTVTKDFVDERDNPIDRTELLGKHLASKAKERLIKDLTLPIGSIISFSSSISIEGKGVVADITSDRVEGFIMSDSYKTFSMSKWNFLSRAIKVGQMKKEEAEKIYIKVKLAENASC